MSALVITTELPHACPNCDAGMLAEMTMKRGTTLKQIDELQAAGNFDAVRQRSAAVLERCSSCDYTMEVRE